jgi:SAM-dependent methyltransferase
MMVRLDFSGRAKKAARALRVAAAAEPGVALIAEVGPRLPFADESIDEIFVGRAVAYRDDIGQSITELWRICKPGALVHLTLPHASSSIAMSRDPRPRPMLTLQTFNYYDPRTKPADAPSTAFTVERARLRVAGQRGDDSGLALARGPFALFVEKLANGSRGSQYRFERWFAALIGGFEEFDVVLSVVKQPRRSGPATSAAAGSSTPPTASEAGRS